MTNRIQYLKQMTQKQEMIVGSRATGIMKLGGGGITTGEVGSSTAFETNVERTSAGAMTRGTVNTIHNRTGRPTSAYPINGFRRSNDKMQYDHSVGQNKGPTIHHSQIKYGAYGGVDNL
jgi:hypothetical protein